MMDYVEFDDIVEFRICKLRETLDTKSVEYAETDDQLANFRSAADYSDESMRFVCWMYLLKHLTSLKDMCTSCEEYTIERWDEKIGDSIAYLVLLYAIVSEENGTTKQVDGSQDTRVSAGYAPGPGVVWDSSPTTTYQRQK